MAVSTHIGMNTYNAILQNARAQGHPIGPKHHEHNRQFREWEAKQANRTQLAIARKAKKVKGQIREARVAVNEALQKIKAKTTALDEAQRLRDKHAQLQREKIAQGYKTPSWNDGDAKVKSVGNGL